MGNPRLNATTAYAIGNKQSGKYQLNNGMKYYISDKKYKYMYRHLSLSCYMIGCGKDI